MAGDRNLDAELSRLERLVDSGNIAGARKICQGYDRLPEDNLRPEHRFHLQLIRAKIAAVEGNYDSQDS